MEAERIRELTIDHLDWIEKRINQSVKMLSRLPEIEEKVKPEISMLNMPRLKILEYGCKLISSQLALLPKITKFLDYCSAAWCTVQKSGLIVCSASRNVQHGLF